ncbi:MAG: sigma-70 family RNA polymerase sigma factor [Pirellula sp.]
MNADSSKLIEHFFRHEYGRLVAVLTKRFGLRRIDLAEDVAQSALTQALRHWARSGIPDNPGGWLYRVASRLAIDALRRETLHNQRMQDMLHEASRAEHCTEFQAESWDDDECVDDQLRLLLACCSPELSHSSSIALALKVMGGFSIPEISHALLTSQANVQKRITRAKERLSELPTLSANECVKDRVDAATMVLYLLFNEGYLSSHTEVSIRRDLCHEAKRLALLLANHAQCDKASIFALLGLMSFHMARLDARTDSSGEMLLLDRQDRSQWDWAKIREGMDWMQRSADGTEVTRYHIEASIAWEHCRARRFEDTDWGQIRHLYDLLIQRISSPAQWLNRAIAEFYCNGPTAALQIIEALPQEQQPKEYPIWHAVIGFLQHKNGNMLLAKEHWVEALRCTHSRAEQELLRRRIASCIDSRPETQ